MMAECMMKKSKGVMDVKRDGGFVGVMTRSKIRDLQKEGGEFLQLGSRGGVKKRQKKGGEFLNLGNKRQQKGKRGGGKKKKNKKKKKNEEEEGVKDMGEFGEEEMVEGDLGGVDVVESCDLDGIGGGLGALGGEVAANGGGLSAEVGDAMIDGDTAFGGLVADEKGGVDGAEANADGVDGDAKGGIDGIAPNGDSVIGGGGDNASSGGGSAAAMGGVDGGQGAELGGDVGGGNDRVIRENTPEHLIMRSGFIGAPCSSMKDANAVADERPQTEVGGNSHQHMQLTTDLLLQENSNYAPSMEKYNFDFENEKPLFGRYEWEKVQP